MTPKEKAEELVSKLHKEIDSMYSGYWEVAKAQAIICINEILPVNEEYWEEVKKEINLL